MRGRRTEDMHTEKAAIAKLSGKLGRRAIGQRTGLGEWTVRLLQTEMGLAGRDSGFWLRPRPDLAPQDDDGQPLEEDYTADDYLRDHAGEQGIGRLAREIGCSRNAVRCRLSRLRLRISEMRTDLTATAVAKLVGWSEDWVIKAFKAKKMRGRKVDGVWRIWPSELRDWIVDDVRRVRWERVERQDLLEVVSLLVGDWGVSDDAKKAKKRQGAGA